MVDITGEYKNDPQMRAVSLGVEITHFIEFDPVGKYLVERAHQARIDALEELAIAPAHDYHHLVELQAKARIPDLFLSWLDEALAAAAAAEETIKLEEAAGLAG